MAFAQLTFRESLRDIEVCLRAQNSKLYHLGIRGHVARSNLADANEKRDWRILRWTRNVRQPRGLIKVEPGESPIVMCLSRRQDKV